MRNILTKVFICSVLALLLMAVFPAAGLSQDANQWRFGNNAGLNFDEDGGVTAVESPLFTQEGVSTISNEDGELLFYTDGVELWNGDDVSVDLDPQDPTLHGHDSSTQSALIVPNPADPDMYYIFTTGATEEANRGRLSVSEIHAPSPTDVTWLSTIALIDPNQEQCVDSLSNPNGYSVAEKLTAVAKCGEAGYWIVTHDNGDNNNCQGESNGRNFYVFEIDSEGLVIPDNLSEVAQPMGIDHQLDDGTPSHAVGYMKFSPDGRSIAHNFRNHDPELIVINGFDVETGTIDLTTGSTTIIDSPEPGQSFTYGLEFSPNGEILYFGTLQDIYQVDLTSQNLTPTLFDGINNNAQAIRAFQTAPDGNIYVSINGHDHIGVISNPNDEVGLEATFNPNQVELAGNSTCSFGLPNFVQSNFAETLDFTWEQINCEAKVQFFGEASGDPENVSWEWDFGDGNMGEGQNPCHQYSDFGTYIVSLKDANGDSCLEAITYEVTINECDGPCADMNAEAAFVFEDDCLKVTFTDVSTYSSKIEISDFSTIEWDFGYLDSEGNPVTSTSGLGDDVEHVFPEAGVYVVCITLHLIDGENNCCYFTYCEEIEIGYGCDCIVDHDFIVTVPFTCPNNCCFVGTFINNMSIDPTFVYWDWDASDGLQFDDEVSAPFHDFHTYDYSDNGWKLVTVRADYHLDPENPSVCCTVIVQRWILVQCQADDNGDDRKNFEEEKEMETSFNIYPNPFYLNNSQQLSVSLETQLEGNLNLSIFDVSGKMVHEELFFLDNKSLFSVELDRNLNPGIYLVKVKHSNGFRDQVRLIIGQ